MKPLKRDRDRVFDLLDELGWLFSVNNLKLTVSFVEKGDKDGGTCNHNLHVTADIVINTPYQRIHINIFPSFWGLTPQEQRECILHEYCHALIEPTQRVVDDLFEGRFHTESDITDAVEESTSKVAAILSTLLSGGAGYAYKAYDEYIKKPRKNTKQKKATWKETKKT